MFDDSAPMYKTAAVVEPDSLVLATGTNCGYIIVQLTCKCRKDMLDMMIRTFNLSTICCKSLSDLLVLSVDSASCKSHILDA